MSTTNFKKTDTQRTIEILENILLSLKLNSHICAESWRTLPSTRLGTFLHDRAQDIIAIELLIEAEINSITKKL